MSLHQDIEKLLYWAVEMDRWPWILRLNPREWTQILKECSPDLIDMRFETFMGMKLEIESERSLPKYRVFDKKGFEILKREPEGCEHLYCNWVAPVMHEGKPMRARCVHCGLWVGLEDAGQPYLLFPEIDHRGWGL